MTTATIEMPTAAPSVPVVSNIGREEFYNSFVTRGRSVIIKNATSEWPALKHWDAAYFGKIGGDLKCAVKNGNVAKGQTSLISLRDYGNVVMKYESEKDPTAPRPPYLHDVPIFHLIPQLNEDISPFPLHYLPKWYWDKAYQYIQFFMSANGSVTPLHFDTLYTHNLFFQVVGRKRFIIISADQVSKCYPYNWRWAAVDAQNPDFEKYPLFRDVSIQFADLGPGDILYLPTGTLHQVHSLSFSISFNIDWHTQNSVVKGLLSVFKGAPLDNFYYNALIAAGIIGRVPSNYIFKYYKSYLNYVS